jgi:hypothetical protein
VIRKNLDMIIYIISIFLLLNDEIRLCATWTYPDISPKTCIKYGEFACGKKNHFKAEQLNLLIFFFFEITDQTNSHIFFGNITDHYKILDQDETTLLIGAR